jgi:hypothetical protein
MQIIFKFFKEFNRGVWWSIPCRYQKRFTFRFLISTQIVSKSWTSKSCRWKVRTKKVQKVLKFAQSDPAQETSLTNILNDDTVKEYVKQCQTQKTKCLNGEFGKTPQYLEKHPKVTPHKESSKSSKVRPK